MPTREEINDAIKVATESLIKDGKLIEAGFAAYLFVTYGERRASMPAKILEELRDCYMSAAQHLWASINAILDEGAEPTEADMAKMDQINAELTAWYNEKRKQYGLAPAPDRT